MRLRVPRVASGGRRRSALEQGCAAGFGFDRRRAEAGAGGSGIGCRQRIGAVLVLAVRRCAATMLRMGMATRLRRDVRRDAMRSADERERAASGQPTARLPMVAASHRAMSAASRSAMRASGDIDRLCDVTRTVNSTVIGWTSIIHSFIERCISGVASQNRMKYMRLGAAPHAERQAVRARLLHAARPGCGTARGASRAARATGSPCG